MEGRGVREKAWRKGGEGGGGEVWMQFKPV